MLIEFSGLRKGITAAILWRWQWILMFHEGRWGAAELLLVFCDTLCCMESDHLWIPPDPLIGNVLHRELNIIYSISDLIVWFKLIFNITFYCDSTKYSFVESCQFFGATWWINSHGLRVVKALRRPQKLSQIPTENGLYLRKSTSYIRPIIKLL